MSLKRDLLTDSCLRQAGPLQPRVALLGAAAPLVAIKDEAGNTVLSNARIRVSLISNASRPHDWIDSIDAINTTSMNTPGVDNAHRVLDRDLSTFHQAPPGAALTFDLRRRYQLNRIKIQCAHVPQDFNITAGTDAANGGEGGTGGGRARVIMVPASVPIDRCGAPPE